MVHFVVLFSLPIPSRTIKRIYKNKLSDKTYIIGLLVVAR